MKLRSLVHLGMVAFVFSLLTASNQPARAQSGGVRKVSFGGVSFNYDASLASGVEGKLVPETIEGGTIASWMAQPEHIEFNFSDFHGSGMRWQQSTIYVFPVRSDYRSLAHSENRDFWLPGIKQLQELLSKHPNLRTALEQSSTSPNQPPHLPYLPPINAARIATGKAAYLDFRNGLGIRYLVHTTQDVSPPDRDYTAYTFQGLTSDGKYYLAAFFSAFPTSMQPIGPFQGDDIRAFYLDLNDRFDAVSNDEYTPNLDLLDKMIGSLHVAPTDLGSLPGMPQTGATDYMAKAAELVLLSTCLLISGGLLLRTTSRRT